MEVKTTHRLFFEGVLIIVSVVLGFAVSEWRQSAADRDLAETALRNLRAEVEYNLGTLEKQIPTHRQLMETLATVDTSNPKLTGFEIIMSNIRNTASLPLRQGAWDAAVSTGALRLIDYDTAAVLSELYVVQKELVNSGFQRTVTALYQPVMFDSARRVETVQMMRWLFTEYEGNERAMLELYKQALPNIPKTADY